MLGKILLRFKKTHERSWRAYLKAAERLSLEQAHERLVQSLIIAEAAHSRSSFLRRLRREKEYVQVLGWLMPGLENQPRLDLF